jgi:hypothetical protein
MSTQTFTSAHIHPVTDRHGDMIGLGVFCSDSCHRQWCEDTGNTYEGWFGCQEVPAPVLCSSCSVMMKG